VIKEILIGVFKSFFSRMAQPAADVLTSWPHYNAVVTSYRGGHMNEVLRLCGNSLATSPDHGAANYYTGLALIALGRTPEAESPLRKAVSRHPDFVDARAELSRVLHEVGSPDAAEEHARRCVELAPQNPRFRLLLADLLERDGCQSEILEHLAFAQEFLPEDLDVLNRLIRKLDQLGKFDTALRIAERAMVENGDRFETQFFLGYARFVTGDHDGAVSACREAIRHRGNVAGVYITLGSSLLALGDFDAATIAYNEALRLSPRNTDALFHLGMVHLMHGRYREGWKGFEYRFYAPHTTRRKCLPRWDGGSLRGKTLHVMREQGLGDDIMYASCFAELISKAHHCIIECEPRLEKLFRRSFPAATLVPIIDNTKISEVFDRADVDIRIFSASVPGYLRRSPASFPGHKGYLRTHPERASYWRSRLQALGNGLKVGISWRGGTAWTHRRRRVVELESMLPVLSIPGTHWINLQYGNRQSELDELKNKTGVLVIDWPEAIDGDYDETAALVSALDLVVSVCTSVVHLAGALGKNAQVMVPFAAEWRYGAAGESMAWYPSVRLIRQKQPGDWAPVIQSICKVVTAMQQELNGERC
jgi:Flp pilus assembly protein TadD